MEGGKEDVEEQRDKSNTDGKARQLEVEIKVDGEEELHTHPTASWDQPRRLVNPLLTIRFDTDFPFSAFFIYSKLCP